MITTKVNYFILKGFFYLLMNVLIILKTIFLYVKNLFYLKGFGIEGGPQLSSRHFVNNLDLLLQFFILIGLESND